MQVKMNLNLAKSEFGDNTSLAGEMSETESENSVSEIEAAPLAMGPEVTPVRPIGDVTPAFNPMDLFKKYLTMQDVPQENKDDSMAQQSMSDFTDYEAEKQLNIFTTVNKAHEPAFNLDKTDAVTPRCSFDLTQQILN